MTVEWEEGFSIRVDFEKDKKSAINRHFCFSAFFIQRKL